MVPKELIRSILENYGTEIYNIYGPTETTVTSNTTRITNADNINVGKALYNYITEIRDIDGKVLPQGVMGELYIGGYGVAGGYYCMEDKTKEALKKHSLKLMVFHTTEVGTLQLNYLMVKLLLKEDWIIKLN